MTFGPTTVPTRITYARLLSCPVFVFLFWLAVPGQGLGVDGLARDLDPLPLAFAFGLLLLQEASDIVDGVIARRRGQVTDFGKLLDPLADTLSHMGAFMCLMWVGLIPLWLVLVMYYREGIVGTLRILAARSSVVVGARMSGKVKAVAQGAGANLLLLLMIIAHYEPRVPLREVAEAVTWVVGATAVLSLVDYYRSVRALPRKGA